MYACHDHLFQRTRPSLRDDEQSEAPCIILDVNHLHSVRLHSGFLDASDTGVVGFVSHNDEQSC